MLIADTIFGNLTFDATKVACAQRTGPGKVCMYFDFEGTVKQACLNIADVDISDFINDLEAQFVGDQIFVINDIYDYPVMLKADKVVGAMKHEDHCIRIFFNLTSTTKMITVRVSNADIPARIATIESEINGLPIPP